ncbi:unnamed protein product [Discosporangium mesarthrocarpum]
MAGLIKTILVLSKGQAPPNLHVAGDVNPRIDLASLPALLPGGGAGRLTPLKHPPLTTTPTLSIAEEASGNRGAEGEGRGARGRGKDVVRVPFLGGVSSFGFGGTNAHVILSGPPPDDKGGEGGLVGRGREEGGEEENSEGVVFLFTGQGSQYPGMGRGLYKSCEAFRHVMDACDSVLKPVLPVGLLEVIYGEEHKDGSLLDTTRYAQPAIFALECATAAALRAEGIVPRGVVGHSLGELAAACVSGVMGLEEGALLVAERARLMEDISSLDPPAESGTGIGANGQPAGGEHGPGAECMAAMRISEAVALVAIASHGAGLVAVAAVNGPESVVLSGPQRLVEAVAAAALAPSIPEPTSSEDDDMKTGGVNGGCIEHCVSGGLQGSLRVAVGDDNKEDAGNIGGSVIGDSDVGSVQTNGIGPDGLGKVNGSKPCVGYANGHGSPEGPARGRSFAPKRSSESKDSGVRHLLPLKKARYDDGRSSSSACCFVDASESNSIDSPVSQGTTTSSSSGGSSNGSNVSSSRSVCVSSCTSTTVGREADNESDEQGEGGLSREEIVAGEGSDAPTGTTTSSLENSDDSDTGNEDPAPLRPATHSEGLVGATAVQAEPGVLRAGVKVGGMKGGGLVLDGRRFTLLRGLSRAFHSPSMAGAAAAVAKAAGRVPGGLKDPVIPLSSNVTGKVAVVGELSNPEYWGKHVLGTVRFSEGVCAITEALSCSTFVEVGPRALLCNMARKALQGKGTFRWLVAMSPEDRRGGMSGLGHIVGAVKGVPYQRRPLSLKVDLGKGVGASTSSPFSFGAEAGSGTWTGSQRSPGVGGKREPLRLLETRWIGVGHKGIEKPAEGEDTLNLEKDAPTPRQVTSVWLLAGIKEEGRGGGHSYNGGFMNVGKAVDVVQGDSGLAHLVALSCCDPAAGNGDAVAVDGASRLTSLLRGGGGPPLDHLVYVLRGAKESPSSVSGWGMGMDDTRLKFRLSSEEMRAFMAFINAVVSASAAGATVPEAVVVSCGMRACSQEDVVEGWGSSWLPGLLRSLRLQHPHLRIR